MHMCNIAAVFSVCTLSLCYCVARNGSGKLILAIGGQSQIANINQSFCLSSTCSIEGLVATSSPIVIVG